MDGGFAALPGAIRAGLAGGAHRRNVTILLDAFGWRFVERHAEHPLLRRLAEHGALRPVASQFPATTTAHITTLHTGLPVGEHGLYEWRVWEPALRRVISPLLYSWAGASARDTMAGCGVPMEALLPAGPTRYEQLAADGVPSVAFQPAAFSPSTYDRAALRGAEIRPYGDLREGLAALVREAAARERCHAYLYYDAIDATGHRQGPSSAAFDAVTLDALDAIEAAFFGPGARALPDTELLLCADHGQVDVHPERLDLLDVLWPGLEEALERDATGAPVPPAGSARDAFLHVRADRVEEAVAVLGGALGERAEVHRTEDLVATGAFGPAGPRLLERLASVCVLPAAGRMAWLRSAPSAQLGYLGHHGGRHPDEARTFAGTLRLG